MSTPQELEAERRAAVANITGLRRELEAQGLRPTEIRSNAEVVAAQDRLDQALSGVGLRTSAQDLALLNRLESSGRSTEKINTRLNTRSSAYFGGRQSMGATDGLVDDGMDGFDSTDSTTGGTTEDAYYQFLMDRENEAKQGRIQTATESLRVLLKQFFFNSEDAFIEDILRAARPDFEMGLDSEVILKKMEDYENPNSLFAKRFAGNVELRKRGIEPLSPEVYLQQERVYREYLSAVGLNDLANRNTFSQLIGKSIAPTELARRIENVFDVWDSADTAYKNELERTLGVSGIVARNEIAKVLLLGKDAAAELQKKVATAGVATEARARGLGVQSAEQLAAIGVTREQARSGFETIAQAQPTFEKLAGIYDRQALGSAISQTELEQEVFQGMQSQRRKRLTEREQAAFSGSSGITASALSTQRAGQI